MASGAWGRVAGRCRADGGRGGANRDIDRGWRGRARLLVDLSDRRRSSSSIFAHTLTDAGFYPHVQSNGAMSSAWGDHVTRRALFRSWAATLKGDVILPVDSAYDGARRVWNLDIDRRPALIVRCADEDDVVRAVDFARTRDLIVA